MAGLRDSVVGQLENQEVGVHGEGFQFAGYGVFVQLQLPLANKYLRHRRYPRQIPQRYQSQVVHRQSFESGKAFEIRFVRKRNLRDGDEFVEDEFFDVIYSVELILVLGL